jgi:hypothetical protein
LCVRRTGLQTRKIPRNPEKCPGIPDSRSNEYEKWDR